MKTILLIILTSLVFVAMAHETPVMEREREIQKNRVTCLVANQRFIVDYLKCQASCKELQKKNPNYRCSCELWDTALNYCG